MVWCPYNGRFSEVSTSLDESAGTAVLLELCFSQRFSSRRCGDESQGARSGGKLHYIGFRSPGCAHGARREFCVRPFEPRESRMNCCEHGVLMRTLRPLLDAVQPGVLQFDPLADRVVRMVQHHAAFLSAGLTGILISSPSGRVSMRQMGLDRRSSNSRSAGEIAWVGICRRISVGSDRGDFMVPICVMRPEKTSRERGLFRYRFGQAGGYPARVTSGKHERQAGASIAPL